MRTDAWFAGLAVIVLAVLLATALVAATGASDGTESASEWTPDVPDIHDVDEPTEPSVATLDGDQFNSVQAALDAAQPGDTVVLEGTFEEHVTVETEGVTIAAAERDGAVIDGGGEGTIVTIEAPNVTLEGVWIRDTGHERRGEHAGVFVNGTGATVTDVRLTDVSFGVWINGVSDVTVEGSMIAGREDVFPFTDRGNGIHLWDADDAVLRDNYITTVRDGIYYSWAEGVLTENNTMWEMRYGVHYMYSNDNRLEGNVAANNDVGFALMVSENITLVDNVAANNDGTSAHGILLKDVERSEIRGNAVVANGNGFYIYNAQQNRLVDNLVLENRVGVHATAGSSGGVVAGNSFIENDEQAFATTTAQIAWNDSDRGNYWSDASAVDLDGDGTSEIRHRPAGTVEQLVHDRPQAAVFAESPAFDAVRLAESSFPVVESAGLIDHHPLTEPPHDNWRDYYANHDH
ncbi:nitrous oxide reductase family maturation protein NosD [Halobacteria archaeon AArc-curdl1]|uniref:Nitrous oxide reductase family maturation protein NosD n=1 Tax=Natronosalvus hydrolyticus TaxID=2979988 RepID=A0AAP3E796_9EURY|nr:nitrous oxide reductase family maturation protein NosD [Halobacteria archaeon AArc-curdl1]